MFCKASMRDCHKTFVSMVKWRDSLLRPVMVLKISTLWRDQTLPTCCIPCFFHNLFAMRQANWVKPDVALVGTQVFFSLLFSSINCCVTLFHVWYLNTFLSEGRKKASPKIFLIYLLLGLPSIYATPSHSLFYPSLYPLNPVMNWKVAEGSFVILEKAERAYPCLQNEALCLLRISRSTFSIIRGFDLWALLRRGLLKPSILASYSFCQWHLRENQ